jgi:hypothetical protein
VHDDTISLQALRKRDPLLNLERRIRWPLGLAISVVWLSLIVAGFFS